MNPGDIVWCTNSRDLKRNIGLIIKKEEDLPTGLSVYTILSNGIIQTYTSAAVRYINETW